MDRREQFTQQIKDFFHAMDQDGSGDVTADELLEMLGDPTLSAYFRVLGFDIDDANRFILLLDKDSSGSISMDEFLKGCLRYRGGATGVDMHTCLRLVRRMEQTLLDVHSQVTKKDKLSKILEGGLLQGEEELDPADVDSLDDRTAARRKAKAVSSKAVPLPSEGRLRLRANIPVAEGYEGKAVSRQQVFGAEEDDGDFDDDFDAGPQLDFEAPIAGGLNISGDVEEEYEKLMRSTQAELAVMRQPSAEDVDKKRRSAQELKQQMEGWANLVEARIHLEGPLSIAHRLPCGVVASAFKEDQKLAEQSLLAAKEAQKLLATMLNLQQHLAKDRCSFPPLESSEGRVVLESEAWGMVDGRLRGVLDWALGVADGWKEHTRLDSRRSFKVLDQSLQLQMQ
ncbi:unnamed protein product, partial [Effrenium voratum]